MKKQIICICMALCVVSGYAQECLSIAQCIELAKENNKSIKAAQYQMKAYQHDSKSMWANFFPSFLLNGYGLYSGADFKYSSGSGMLPVLDAKGMPVGTSAFFPGIDLAMEMGLVYGGGLMMKQPIFMGGKIATGYKMSKIGTAISQENVRLTEAEVVVKTTEAYANLVKAQQLHVVALEYQKLLMELSRSVGKAYDKGMKTKSDVLKVEVKLNESKLKVRQAENGIRLANMNLCHYIGKPLTEHVKVTEELPFMEQLPTMNDVSARPEYRIMDSKSELARQQIRLEWAERLPQVALLGSLGYMNGVKLNDQKLFDDSSYLLGLTVSVPIFHFGEKVNKVHAARARYNQALAARDDTRELLMLQLTQAANNWDEAHLETQMADSSVESAQENMRVSEKLYAKGMETLSNFLEAQTLWQQALQTQIEAHVNEYLRYLEYQKASGLLS